MSSSAAAKNLQSAVEDVIFICLEETLRSRSFFLCNYNVEHLSDGSVLFAGWMSSIGSTA